MKPDDENSIAHGKRPDIELEMDAMNRHIFGDKLLLGLSHLLGKPFFRNSVDGPDFETIRTSIAIQGEFAATPGYVPIRAKTIDGVHEAGFKVLHWRGAHAPLILFNQGGGEQPFDRSVAKMFPEDSDTTCNVIAVQTSSQHSLKDLNRNFASLTTYTTMVALAVELTQWLLEHPLLSERAGAAVTGYSLGGFVTNRHHLIHDTADVYLPFVAGTRHAEIFFTSIRSGDPAQRNPDRVRDALNFDHAWMEVPHPNVFPSLGRYDQLNLLEIQRPSYGDMPVEIWEGGHLYGVRRPDMLRRRIETKLMEAIQQKEV
ncbi:MAG: hypothetical protein AAF311_01525 [Pseudomonadota bacterium]